MARLLLFGAKNGVGELKRLNVLTMDFIDLFLFGLLTNSAFLCVEMNEFKIIE